ncbi:MAG TPA: hypothetical protein VK834_14095 [Bradyrhizobium sp.]|jgi:hypothetical protein|nr:hypothetical protein [Bradyrhizobium sp.]
MNIESIADIDPARLGAELMIDRAAKLELSDNGREVLRRRGSGTENQFDKPM